MNKPTKDLTFDPHLLTRLNVLADKRGLPLEDLASLVLDEFATAEEQALIERGDLEQRWAQYLENGQTVPVDKIRAKLRDYAADAGRRMEL